MHLTRLVQLLLPGGILASVLPSQVPTHNLTNKIAGTIFDCSKFHLIHL